MTNPNDPAFYDASNVPVGPEDTAEGWEDRPGLTKREKFAESFMAAYLASPNFKFEELWKYARKAITAADIFIEELNKPTDHPKP